MSTLRKDHENGPGAKDTGQWEHPPYPYPLVERNEIDLLELWGVITRSKLLILTITLLATVGAAAYSIVMTPVYRAEALLTPAAREADPGRLASLVAKSGVLADIAGVSSRSGGSNEEVIAILKSRVFSDQFIRDENLLPSLLGEQWDAEKGSLIIEEPSLVRKAVAAFTEMLVGLSGHDGPRNAKDSRPDPSMWIAYKAFDDIRTVTIDEDTGLVTLAVEWTDPRQAAEWGNRLVERINIHMRRRAIEEAERNIRYLNDQVEKTAIFEMQQLLYRLIERETQAIMLANGRDEYAFRVIDPAVTPRARLKPKRMLMTIFGFLAGLGLGVSLAFFVSFVKTQRDVIPNPLD